MTGLRNVERLCDEIRELAKAMDAAGLSRLEVHDGAGRLVLERPVDKFAAFPPPIVLGAPPSPPAPPAEGDDGDSAPGDPADDPDEELLYASAAGGVA